MKIDWASLGLVAVTTVVAAIAIVGIFSLGVMALTSGARTASGVAAPSPAARLGGYLCLAVSVALVLYGLYLIIPQFH
ncbi:MAG TPA: hypothetical protein VIU11_23065 [Nakamurella sp.]